MNSFWEDPAIVTLAIVVVLVFLYACITGYRYFANREFLGIKIGKHHLGILWFVIATTLAIDIWQYYHYSHRQIIDELHTVFTINIAILSVVVILVALALTASGLAKLEVIEERAKEIAKKTATETIQEYLKSTEMEKRLSSVYKEIGKEVTKEFLEFATKYEGPTITGK